MKTIIIDENPSEYFYDNDDWKSYVCDNFDENVVIYKSSEGKSSLLENASWYKQAKKLVVDLEYHYDEDDFMDEYKDTYSEDKLNRMIKIYNTVDTEIEMIKEFINILYPNIKLVDTTIRDFDGRVWDDILYIEDSLDENELEDYMYGNLVDIALLDEDKNVIESHLETGTNYVNNIFDTNTEIYKKNLKDIFGITEDVQFKKYATKTIATEEDLF